MERFVVLPFSIGCASHSSVSVVENSPKRSKADHQSASSTPRAQEGGESIKMKSSIRFLPVPKANISFGIHRLIKSFKNLSQLFVYKEDIEDMEMDMEIGFPTDVKHVAHIGWDGSTATTTTTNHSNGWDMLKTPDHNQLLSSFPSISFKQFELAMAAQGNDSKTTTTTTTRASTSIPLVKHLLASSSRPSP